MTERNAFKCPSCQEETLIQRSETNYECIYCGHRKSFSNDEMSFGGFLLLGFIVVLIVMAILQNFYKDQLTPSIPTNDSPIRELR
jgi:uncharacterized protein (DUF983 family)